MFAFIAKLVFFYHKIKRAKEGIQKQKELKKIRRTQMRRREARQCSRESTKITSLKEGIVTAAWQKRALRMQQSRRKEGTNNKERRALRSRKEGAENKEGGH